MRMANRIFEDPDSDPEQDPPGLVSRGVDHAGLLLLDYPRPLHLAAAVKDFFPIEGTRRTFREVRALYERFGHGADVAITEGYHGHQYSAENQAAAFAFLDRAFGRPVRPGLDPVTTVAPEDLRATPSGQVRVDLPGRSLVDIVRDAYEVRKHQAHPSLAERYGEGYPGIRGLKVAPYAGVSAPATIAWEKAGSSDVAGAIVDRYLLHQGGGLVLPLVHIRPAKTPAARTIVRVSLDGKIRPEDWSEVEGVLARGEALVSFDARGLGETRMAYKAESIDDPELAKLDDESAYKSPISGVLANHVYNALLTGRPYFFQLLDDTEVACRFAREVLGARSVAVSGRDESRLWAAAAASVIPNLELVPPASGERSFSWAAAVEDGRELWPIAYLVPGGAYLRVGEPSGSPPRSASR
jgi:hypothetical protein